MLQGREPVEPPLFNRGMVQQQQGPPPGLDPQAIMALIQRLKPQQSGAQMPQQQGGLAGLMAGKGQRPQQQANPSPGGMFTGGVAP